MELKPLPPTDCGPKGTIISRPATLRSLRNEAGRQGDFFRARDPQSAQTWHEIEALAHMALSTGCSLTLLFTPDLTEYPLIKSRE